VYVIELMNMGMLDQVMYLTMTYDYIDGPLPQGWSDIKTAWLDVKQCEKSDFFPPFEGGYFQAESLPWKPNFEGKVMGIMTHLHDGGLKMDVVSKRDVTLCTADARYSESPEYVYRNNMGIMNGDKVAKNHISSMAGCDFSSGPPAMMTKDQAWSFRGYYDYDLREGNLEQGKQSEIMVLGIVQIAVPVSPVPRPAGRGWLSS